MADRQEEPATPTISERFWRFVDKTGECWEWTGHRSRGHGKFRTPDHVTVSAHRFAYQDVVGPIPEGLSLDHLCRNRGCVNPAHLEPVTNRENILRGIGPTAMNAKKTHCIRGHLLSGANVQWVKEPYGSRSRRCRTCTHERRRREREKRRAERLGGLG